MEFDALVPVKRRIFSAIILMLTFIIIAVPEIISGYIPVFLAQCIYDLIVIIAMGMIILSIYHFTYQKKLYYFGIILAILYIVFDLTSIALNSIPIMLIGQVFLSIFILFTLVYVAKAVLTKYIVDANIIYGAVLIFLLVGFLFSKIYFLLEMNGVQCFDGMAAPDPTLSPIKQAIQLQFDMLYASFNFLSNAIGDIKPKCNIGKSLVVVEMVFAQLFLAITISRIVTNWRNT